MWSRRPRARTVLMTVVALFLLDLVVAVGGVGISLAVIRSRFTSFDVTVAGGVTEEIHDLEGIAGRAQWFASHPSYRLAAKLVPDLEVAGALCRAAAEVAGDTAELLSLLSAEGDGGLYQAGVVDIARLGAAELAAEDLHQRLVGWSQRLGSLEEPWLDRVNHASVRVSERLRKASRDVSNATLLLDRLPSILGEDEQRSYLLVFQSPSEARGGGGLIGVVAELKAFEGRLSLGQIRTVRDLVKRMHGTVAAPRSFEKTYGPLLATREWRSVNVSPNFPITSRVLLRMYRRSLGRSLDGVIAADPLTIAALTKATGPLKAGGWDVSINADNARRVLLHDVYRHFHFLEHRQNRYFANLVDVIWNAASSGDVEVADLASSLSESVRKQHLKVFFARSDEQDAIEAVGAHGSFANEEGVQLVFNNNWSANKIDFFLYRRVETAVRLQDGGQAQVSTEISLTNRVENLERNVISRPGVQRGLGLGLNRTLVSVLLPEGATKASVFVEGRAIEADVGLDAGHPVVSAFVDIPPKESRVVAVSYSWPEAVQEARFAMTLFPQATVRPDAATLTVSSPDGERLLQKSLQLKEPLRISLPVDS